jgi:hypothetical protein
VFQLFIGRSSACFLVNESESSVVTESIASSGPGFNGPSVLSLVSNRCARQLLLVVCISWSDRCWCKPLCYLKIPCHAQCTSPCLHAIELDTANSWTDRKAGMYQVSHVFSGCTNARERGLVSTLQRHCGRREPVLLPTGTTQ